MPRVVRRRVPRSRGLVCVLVLGGARVKVTGKRAIRVTRGDVLVRSQGELLEELRGVTLGELFAGLEGAWMRRLASRRRKKPGF